MSYISTELYTVVCDNCNETYTDQDRGIGFWIDKGDCFDAANDDGWNSDFDTGKHYCPDCHRYDDEDNLIINIEKKYKNF